MRTRWLILAFAVSCAASLSCKSPEQPPTNNSRLEVFVGWDGEGLADRKLEIVELGLVQLTDTAGTAVFALPPGSYTLRAYVTGPGPSLYEDLEVKTQEGQTTHVTVVDCLVCVNAR